jgi:D-methionine transport system ATP-binding protein
VDEGTVFDVFTKPRADVTRSFVRDVVERALPERIAEAIRSTPPGEGRPVWRIVFTGPSALVPVVSDLVKRFDVTLNILQANVDYIQGAAYGNIVLEASGSPAALDAAVAHVRSLDLQLEILGHVPAA